MRKTILGMLAVVAVALTIASPANAGHKRHHIAKPVLIGAIVGTIVGISVYEGSNWLGSSTFAASSTGAAVTGGLIAGVATATMIHALTTPCTGFHAIVGGAGCKNGKHVHARHHRHHHHHGLLWWLH